MLWFFISLGSALQSAESNNFTNAYATIEGQQMWLHASGDLFAQGARLKALAGLNLSVSGDIIITPFKTEHYNKVVSRKSGFLGTRRNEFELTERNTTVSSSRANAGRDLTFESKNGNIALQAANLQAGGDITLKAENGQILMLVDRETAYVNEKKYKESLVWWKSKESGSYSETIVHNQLRAGGSIVFDAGNGVFVEYNERGASIEDSIRTLSRKPELAWMAQLRTRNDVEWNAVRAKLENWDYEAEGLTQGAAAMIALAVTLATQGAGSGLVATLGGTAFAGTAAGGITASVMQAAITSIASTAAVSLINNKGDLGAVLKELGSQAFIRQLATSMLTAGLTAGLPTDVLPTALPGQTLGFADMLQANIIRGAISASVGTAIQGGDLGENLGNAMINAAVQTVGAQAAIAIGSAAANGTIDRGLQLVAHAALGCAIGAATSRDTDAACVGGAVGGVVGEVSAQIRFRNWLSDRANDPIGMLAMTDEQIMADFAMLRSSGVNMARFLGALSAFAIGGDVNTGAQAGGNAAENNAMGPNARRCLQNIMRCGRILEGGGSGGGGRGTIKASDLFKALWQKVFGRGAYKYHPRIRERGLQDPVAHNFPYSYDSVILKVKPIRQSDGSLLFRKAGSLNGLAGHFEIAVNPSSRTIFHRTFVRNR